MEKVIDQAYRTSVKAKRRMTKIEDITSMLGKMSDEQLENVHKYTVDEYNEPNHEAEALEAIIQMSRKAESENLM